ncbi:MAG: DUF4270 domain-containing protein [Muribaculaceae bacterium]|nr:DUF4270 domain-containing protein [Muribaculaceae bacterium]
MTLPYYLRKRLGLLAAPFSLIAAGSLLLSCENETPTVGSTLASGEVKIALDSLIWNGTEQTIHRGDQEKKFLCPKIEYTTVFDDAVDSRSTTNLLGRISVPEYGDLHCSYVSRLMCATKLDIPDSIVNNPERIDSMKLVLSVPRGALTGDSLAPQQLTVYRLTKSLPKDIDNRFDPTGYYDPASPLGSRSFTLSALGMSDSLYTHLPVLSIAIPLSREMALETIQAYLNPSTSGIFAWPQTFEQYFHGIYVEPSFGRGCVANISYNDFIIYYHYYTTSTSQDNDGNTVSTVKTNLAAAGVFASSPIVLSSNNVTFRPSDYLTSMAAENKAIITSPGGYKVNFRFPARKLVDIYQESQSKMAVVSNLSFSIPVEEIQNDYDITPPPYLLMVKTSKLKDFLASNSLPDNKDSFYAKYSSSYKMYAFSSMRDYILDLIKNGVKDEDLDFTIIPANIEFETNQSSSYNNSYYSWLLGYYSSSSSSSEYPTKCTPYISKPSMCRLKMDEAKTIFTYSIQQMK